MARGKPSGPVLSRWNATACAPHRTGVRTGCTGSGALRGSGSRPAEAQRCRHTREGNRAGAMPHNRGQAVPRPSGADVSHACACGSHRRGHACGNWAGEDADGEKCRANNLRGRSRQGPEGRRARQEAKELGDDVGAEAIHILRRRRDTVGLSRSSGAVDALVRVTWTLSNP
eukprot:scaffold58427_cov69-Phaeocystis_antarctica.AAC.2